MSPLPSRFFVALPVFTLKYIFANVLNLGVSIKRLVLGISFSMSAALLRAAVVTKLIILAILFLISVAYCIKGRSSN